MKKFTIQILALLVVIFAGMLLTKNTSLVERFLTGKTPVDTVQIEIDETLINAEIADDPAKRSKGLGGRESLASQSGMLFIFDRKDLFSFWMKNMKFPIDILWVRDGEIVDIDEEVPPPTPGTNDKDLKIYQPNQAVNMVLEVNSGFAKHQNIKVGDKIKVKE